mmetsp:Transcript_590/g.704  ORF Transcript_590/g.704 Transcript_590/m.704 type:complete len:948 (+) Transcript_590:230-3073(+)|eukprot:CAMPEP_0197851506 /NCGR_PEP_ID=MMETSP1438-20131217/18254_1 /TAXON_ID=1461541 /ORGANISM="Pterosperma sp., Strain CCMP1384" /LENGTH=947 /DNA_ID=CAMNT_0043465125 /DNA_START=230 /DNA_END=3073 /DNA_ORIENTATION=+
MAHSNITQLLLNTLDADAATRQEAEATLERGASSVQDYTQLVFALTAELANPAAPVVARQTAGIYLKNTLRESKDLRTKDDNKNRWFALAQEIRDQIKLQLLQTLKTEEPIAGSAAAQVIAQIAAYELLPTVAQWPTLIPSLCQSEPSVAVFQALQYIFDAFEPEDEVLNKETIDQVLTILCRFVDPEDKAIPHALRRAATRALSDALPYCEENFKRPAEQGHLLKLICGATVFVNAEGVKDDEVRQAAWECLTNVAQEHYSTLDEQVYGNILILTLQVQNDPHEAIVLQAIEFWTTIADHCIFGDDSNEELLKTLQSVMSQAAPTLVPFLLQLLTTQEEGQHEDSTWNKSKAAAICLENYACVLKEGILSIPPPPGSPAGTPVCCPENVAAEWIRRPEWNFQEAGLMIVNAVLLCDELPGKRIEGSIGPILGMVIERLRMAPNSAGADPQVKDTAAYCLGKIFERLVDVEVQINKESMVVEVLGAYEHILQEPPITARNLCWSISCLSAWDQNQEKSLLAPYFQNLVHWLLTTAYRADAGEQNLRLAAYESLNELIRNIARLGEMDEQLLQQLHSVGQHIVGKLHEGVAYRRQVEQQGNREEVTNMDELLDLLCGVLQAVISALDRDLNKEFALLCMRNFIEVLNLPRDEMKYNPNPVSPPVDMPKKLNLSPDAVGAVSALMQDHVKQTLTGSFQHLFKYLFYVFQQNEEEINTACIHLASSMSGILTVQDAEISRETWDGLLKTLCNMLSRQDVPRTLKPILLTCIGDIALCVPMYVQDSMLMIHTILRQAMDMYTEMKRNEAKSDESEEDYLENLAAGIITTYQLTLPGFKEASSPNEFPALVGTVVEFILCMINFNLPDVELEATLIDSKWMGSVVGLLADILARDSAALLMYLNTIPDPNRTTMFMNMYKILTIGQSDENGTTTQQNARMGIQAWQALRRQG